ncbi:3-dehydroquinate synthase [Porphyridium purpureum]|uniref:3-dehydroquinate synthase n=1 Tax=Porphyridium purpureum TaxID=35688 RepID=A0A5J4Z459_PORPP|nr:3-dehydroquinate synthase [Porphyridium purpureum]|eukprot:POR1160..scf295_1
MTMAFASAFSAAAVDTARRPVGLCGGRGSDALASKAWPSSLGAVAAGARSSHALVRAAGRHHAARAWKMAVDTGAVQTAGSEREELTVQAASRTYPIVFGENVLSDVTLLGSLCRGHKALIVTNDKVGPLYMARVRDALERAGKQVFVEVLPDGEQYKSVASLGRVWDACMSAQLDRKSTLFALGGGVVGDIAGFAAATFVRGIDFVQLPTTLLAVVDSAVGGKTAVNHPAGKNMIGAFYQPTAVLVDALALRTLDNRQYAAGVAEIVKYGLIADAAFFEYLEANMDALMSRDPSVLRHAMRVSCQCKAGVVAADEREGGVRAILNLGHTFGHAIEAHEGYGSWLHGEAVAAGMVMAAEMSCRLGWLPREVVSRTEALLARVSLPIVPPPTMAIESFMRYMSVDKKVEAGVLKLILLDALGSAKVTADFDKEVLYDTIMLYQQRFKANPGKYMDQSVAAAGSSTSSGTTGNPAAQAAR